MPNLEPFSSGVGGPDARELPASVRVALWGTAALAGQLPPEEVAARALPDLDHVEGLRESLELWRSLGERALLCALPRPGGLGGLPAGTAAEGVAAATEAQECVLAPGLGGALVPVISPFGPAGDEGWAARWQRYDVPSLPLHRVEALELGQLELGLRRELAEATELLLAVDRPALAGRPGAGRRGRGAAYREWGLPDGLPPRAVRVIELAGTVLRLAEAGLEPSAAAVDLTSTGRREVVLRRLRDHAAAALADAASYGALALAGWR